MPNDLIENEDLEYSTQLFDLEPATNLPELLFFDKAMLTVSTEIICNKCGKIFQRTYLYRKHGSW